MAEDLSMGWKLPHVTDFGESLVYLFPSLLHFSLSVSAFIYLLPNVN